MVDSQLMNLVKMLRVQDVQRSVWDQVDWRKRKTRLDEPTVFVLTETRGVCSTRLAFTLSKSTPAALALAAVLVTQYEPSSSLEQRASFIGNTL